MGPARLLLLPTDVRDVVSFRGSFRTLPDLSGDDDLVQSVLADVLDKGTRQRDRFQIAEDLEGRGARLSFYSDTLQAGFSGRALREDVADVLALAAEQVREPALDEDEVQKALVQAIAETRRARESTGAQAAGALVRRIYGPAHPNFVRDPDEEIARLELVTPDAVRAYHAEHFGAADLTVVAVGDVPVDGVEAAVGRAFDGWASPPGEARFEARAAPAAPGRTDIPMADRQNLDVRLGHGVDLRRDSPDFLATYAGVFALGGNFSSRLMQTVRDDQGLTYGIGASLGASSVEYDGHVYVTVGLSRENLARGVAATRAEVERFVAEGVSEADLDQARTTLAGQHVVALATTGSVAARLLVNAERGFDVAYLDRYPDLVRALTVPEVNAALRRHLRPAELQEAVAGTLPDPA